MNKTIAATLCATARGMSIVIFVLLFAKAVADPAIPGRFPNTQSSVEEKLESILDSIEKRGESELNSICPDFPRLMERYQDIGDFVNGLAKAKRNGKFGAITYTGLEIVPCIYDELYAFNGGLALARRNGKFGIVNNIGEEIIGCRYDKIVPSWIVKEYIHKKDTYQLDCFYGMNGYLFDSNGRVGVVRDGMIGYVDKKGKEELTVFGKDYICVDDRFEDTYSRNVGFLVVMHNKWGWLDDLGRMMLPCEYDDIYSQSEMPVKGHYWARKNGKKLLLDKRGTVVEPCAYGYMYAFQDNGLARFEIDGKWGVTDRKGKVIVECKYGDIGKFENGVARVRSSSYSVSDWRYGVIDESGREIIPCRYKDIFLFSQNGFAEVKKDGKYGVVDRQGNEVIPCVYDAVDMRRKDGLWGLKRNGLWEVVDKFGNQILPPSDYYIEDVNVGFTTVVKDWKWGLVDINGKVIIPRQYPEINFLEGYIIVKDGGGITHVCDFEGRKFFSTKYYFPYETFSLKDAVELKPASLLIACVETPDSRLYGCLDSHGRTVVPFKYEYIRPFDSDLPGLAKVQIDDKWGFIDRDGRQVLPCEYEDIDFIESRKEYGKSEEYNVEPCLGRICKDSKWGFMDRHFNVVVPCRYDKADWFKDGFSRVKLSGKYGYINTKGREIIPCRYDELSDFKNGFAHYRLDGRYGLVNLRGEEFWFKGN